MSLPLVLLNKEDGTKVSYANLDLCVHVFSACHLIRFSLSIDLYKILYGFNVQRIRRAAKLKKHEFKKLHVTGTFHTTS